MAIFDSFIDLTPATAVVVNSALQWVVHAPADQPVTIRWWADAAETSATVVTMTWTDGRWTATITPPTAGLWWYTLQVNGHTYGAPATGQGGPAVPGEAPYQVTVVRRLETVPAWYQQARVYHLFVDRFAVGTPAVLAPHPESFIYGQLSDPPMYIKDRDGNVLRWDFYGGNLRGIIAHLPLLVARGFNTVLLSPIFAARSNHRYDTADYFKIEPMLGTREDFEALVAALHERGMHLILDGVFNHVGRDSRYFNALGHYPSVGATAGPASPYYDWFTFRHFPDDYVSWWNVKDLPAINKTSQSFHDFIAGSPQAVVNTWTAAGVDGWRLDVADELSTPFLQQLRQTLEGFGQKVLIGEVWEDASNKVAYGERRSYLAGDQLQAVMNYPLRSWLLAFVNGTMNGQNLANALLTMQQHYPPATFAFNLNNIGTHDTSRVLTAVGGDLARLRQAVMLLMTLPGVPTVYYGDEVGLTGGKDPANRAFYPWGRENKAVLRIFQEALMARQTMPALAGDAAWWPFWFGPGFGFVRAVQNQTVLVAVNPTGTELAFEQADLRYVPAKYHAWLKQQHPLPPQDVVVLPY